jgi:hypothetical protein
MRRARLAALVTSLTLLVAACGTNDSDTSANTSDATTARKNTTTSSAPATTSTRPKPAVPLVDLCAYRDLGAWVDVYDYVPAFAENGQVSPVTPDAVTAMQAHGVNTLYLQVAKDDPRSPGIITDEARAAEFLQRAHAAGIKVVAWYLPTHRDHALDRERVVALAKFRAGNERFDGVALDIEGTEAVADVAERNRRLLDLIGALDAAAGTMPVGAIVYPPVAFDVLNPTLWPAFPWTELKPHVDVWLPMAYWTYRSIDTPYRDAYRYVSENVERLRQHIADADAPVHVIGGLAEDMTAADIDGMHRAAREQRSLGVSVYDFNTTSPDAWPLLAVPSTC